MKRIVLCLFACQVVFFFTTCKKDPKDIPIGTIKTKINGDEKTFSIQAKATRLTVTGGYGIQVIGYYRNGSTTNLTFTIARPQAIATGTYTENTTSNPLVTMTHCVEVLFPCVLQTNSHGSVSNPVSITITEITNTYVKGTFKGELQTPGPAGTGTSTENFTNGVFHVSF